MILLKSPLRLAGRTRAVRRRAARLLGQRESRRRTPSAPASKRATSPAKNCGPIATARSLISSCTPLPYPKYTRMRRRAGDGFHAVGKPVAGESALPGASCTSTHESAEKLKRRRARPAPGTVASTAAGGARMRSRRRRTRRPRRRRRGISRASRRQPARLRRSRRCPALRSVISLPARRRDACAMLDGDARMSAQCPRLARRRMPGLPPQNSDEQQHRHYARAICERLRLATVGASARVRSSMLGPAAGASAADAGARFVTGQDLVGRQAQQGRVLLQMALGVNRRPDAFVVVRLERIDHPAIQVHFVSRFLRAQTAALALGFEADPGECRGLAHRSTPLRIFCACSESGNSVCTRRAKTAASTVSPSLRCARKPSHRISGVGALTAR